MMLVARLESNKLWRHPIFWGLLIISFSLLTLFFYRLCVDYLRLAHEALAQQGFSPSLSTDLLKPLCSWAIVILAIFLPIFTTYAFSQEYRHKTFYLWATSPLKATHLVGGKFLSLLTLVIFLQAFLLLLISALSFETALNWGNIFTALLAVGLVGSCFISFGLFISSLVSSPSLAIGITLIGNLFWMLLEWLNPFPGHYTHLSQAFSLVAHSYHLLNGLIYSNDIIFYLLFNLFWLTLTQRHIHYKIRDDL